MQRGARLYLCRGLAGGDGLWPPRPGPGPRHPHPVFISVVPSGVSVAAAPACPPAPPCESERETPSPRGVFPGWSVLPALPTPCQPRSLGRGAGASGLGTTARGSVPARQPAGSGEDAARRREVLLQVPGKMKKDPQPGWGRGRGCRQRAGTWPPQARTEDPGWEPVPSAAWGRRGPSPRCGAPSPRPRPPRTPRAGSPALRGAGVGSLSAARSARPGRRLPIASLVWSVTPVAKPASVLSFI